MSHTSPATFLVWSVLSTLFGAFFLVHLWRFDRFKCLKWSERQEAGAFKRVMSYTYLFCIPLLIVYSYGFAIMKYNRGYTSLPSGGFIPTPYDEWPQSYQNAIFPLTLAFSFAWALEMVTHLEELCFWLFLVNAGAQQPDWFRSVYFRSWAAGSIVALIYMPLATSLSRSDLLRCEAVTFFAGSVGSLLLTVSFLPILWTFPSFLRKIKREGVDKDSLVRLTKYYELNVLRIIFRFIFVLPLFALGVDGVGGHTHHVNESLFWTDFLIIVASVGSCVSSLITLFIFFPRSFEAEMHAHEHEHARAASPAPRAPKRAGYLLTDSPVRRSAPLDAYPFRAPAPLAEHPHPARTPAPEELAGLAKHGSAASSFAALPTAAYGFGFGFGAPGAGAGADGDDGALGLAPARLRLQRHGGASDVNPIVHSFTSPIDMASRSSRISVGGAADVYRWA